MFRNPSYPIIGWSFTVIGSFFGGMWLVLAEPAAKIGCAPFALLMAIVGYVVYARPKVVADERGVTIVNPLRTTHVSWPKIKTFKADHLLNVYRRGGLPPLSAWAVQAANITRILGKTSYADRVAAELNAML